MIPFHIQDTDGNEVTMFLRPIRESDVNYIRSSWYREYQPLAKVSPAVFSRNHPGLIEELLSTKTTVVCCSEESPDIAHGWACGEMDGPLHFAFVPFQLRGRGIARAMIAAVLGGYTNHIDVTHRFKGRPDSHRFSFNPYILRVNA